MKWRGTCFHPCLNSQNKFDKGQLAELTVFEESVTQISQVFCESFTLQSYRSVMLGPKTKFAGRDPQSGELQRIQKEKNHIPAYTYSLTLQRKINKNKSHSPFEL